MATIIKRGEAHILGPWQVDCGKCQSTIEFTRPDRRCDQRDGDYYVCPVCAAWLAAKVVEAVPRKAQP